MLEVVGFERKMEERVVQDLQGNDTDGKEEYDNEFQVFQDEMGVAQWVPMS